MTVWQEAALDAARRAALPRRTGRVSRLVGLRLSAKMFEEAAATPCFKRLLKQLPVHVEPKELVILC